MSEQRNELLKWAKGEATEKERGKNETKVVIIIRIRIVLIITIIFFFIIHTITEPQIPPLLH